MLKRHGLKKGLSLVLVFCLILSLMPTVALAQEPTASTGTETTEGVTGTEGGSAGTGDTTGAEGGSTGTGDTTGTEGGSTEGGDTTGTGTGDTTGEDSSILDEIKDVIDNILKPIPGEKTPEEIAAEEAAKKAEEEAAAQAAAEEAARLEAERLAAEQARAEELASVLDVGDKKDPRDTSDDGFYRVVHLDAGRKYFTSDEIKTLIDNAAAAGYNQLELYLSDNEGFRFALDDMEITTGYDTYDLSNALSVDGCLDQTEMSDLIDYAKEKGVEIVPCINTPGHMGAILDAFQEFRYSGSNTSIDLTNPEAVAFALAIVEKYAAYFAGEGCDFFNIGADEYANDIGDMGFARLYGYAGENGYEDFVNYLNAAAQVVINEGMTPRAFNDGIYYNDDTDYGVNTAVQVCYWSNGWGGYEVASADTISKAGHQMINTHGDYYWVLGNPKAQCDAEKAKTFDYESFMGSTISNPEGAMFCIWCDSPNADSAENVIADTADVLKAFGSTLPQDTYEGTTVYPVNPDTNKPDYSISVTAPGLTSVTVTPFDMPMTLELNGEAAELYMAYDIQPYVGEGPYQGKAQVTLLVPDGWNVDQLSGFVRETDGSITKIPGTYRDGSYTFEMPHFSVGGIMQLAPQDIKDMGSITVGVGGTTTATISGLASELSGVVIDDSSVVHVTVDNQFVPGTDGGTKDTLGAPISTLTDGRYVIASGNNAVLRGSRGVQNSSLSSTNPGTVISNLDCVWTVSNSGDKYTITNSNEEIYLGLKGHLANNYSLTLTDGNNAEWSYDGQHFYQTVEGWLDNYTYYLNFNSGNWSVTQQINNATSLTLYPVVSTELPDGENTYTATITFEGLTEGTTTVTVGGIYQYEVTVEPADLSGINQKVEFWITNQKVTAGGETFMQLNAGADTTFSENGVLFEDVVPATGYSDSGNPLVFWKGTRLTADRHQIEQGDDQTLNGDDFTRIRYWNNTWAILTDSGWEAVSATDQLVAYYLQRTEITKEVTTNVVDWGEKYADWLALGLHHDWHWFWDGYVANGTKFVFLDFAVVYEEGTQNPSSFPVDNTWFFHFDGNSAYNPRRLGAITFDETDQFEIWKVTEQDGTCSGYSSAWQFKPTYSGDEKVVWNEDMGGDPHIDQLLFYANRSGKLIRVYVRAKATEDSLTVRYVDKKANQEFYSYNITVQEGTVFNENIDLGSGKNTLVHNTVNNVLGVQQSVSADLSKLTEIGEQYRFSDYECVQVERSEDGKEVTLYYTFSNTKDFVVDFGLPVDITFDQLGIQNATTGTVAGAKYGSASVMNSELHYVPEEVMAGTETLQLTVNGVTHTIYLYPATTVYYEQGFADYRGSWTDATAYTGSDMTQTAELAGKAENPYGYDPAYNNASESVAESKNVDDTATFTFTGTGVDIYAKCGQGTGVIMIQVDGGATHKTLVVDTAMKAGTTDVTNEAHQVVEANSIPIASIDGLARQEYTVTITHVKRSEKDTGVDPVYLDGFRVHGTLSTVNTTYAKDNEADPTIRELRDAVLKVQLDATDATSASNSYKMQIANAAKSQIYSAVILSDAEYQTSLDIVAQDLLDNGPKNELYLAPNETLVFKVDKADGKNVQVGLKNLTAGANCSVNGKTVKSSTDMFYKVTPTSDGYVTIQNTGSGILAVTELKVASGS